MKSIERITDVDSIISFLGDSSGKMYLTDRQQNMLERIDFAYDLLRKDFRTERYVQNLLVTKFQITKATAFSDIQNVKQVYGTLTKTSKNYYRQIAINMALETYAIAKVDKDTKGMNDATARFIDATGVKHDDPELPNFKKIEQHIYVLTPATTEVIGLEIPSDLEERVQQLKQRKRIESKIIQEAEVIE